MCCPNVLVILIKTPSIANPKRRSVRISDSVSSVPSNLTMNFVPMDTWSKFLSLKYSLFSKVSCTSRKFCLSLWNCSSVRESPIYALAEESEDTTSLFFK